MPLGKLLGFSYGPPNAYTQKAHQLDPIRVADVRIGLGLWAKISS